jgi:tetratricopeptide (TPR) repeat protein
MRLQLILLPLLAASISFEGHAQTNHEQDLAGPGIEHLRNLEYDDAKVQLRGCVDAHPSDLRAWNYLAIATLYDEMFERGVLESGVYGEGGEIFKPSKVAVTPSFQQELFSILDKSQQIAEERLKGDPNDKDAMYWAGVGHGTRATYHFALRKEYLSALHEATAAYKYHSDLLKLDANYVDSYLVVGVNNYVVGSLPWYFKVFASLTGRHGDRAEGLQQIKRVTEQGNYAREDSKLMLAVLYQREKMYGPALALYQEMARSYPRNYLLQYEVSSLMGMMNDWRSAAQAYDSILSKHRAGDSGYENIPIAKVLYKSGQAYERIQQDESALNRYSEAGALLGTDRYIYTSELAAASLYMGQQRPDAARAHYQRVADAMPGTEEGKTARRVLRRLGEDANSSDK